MRANVAIFGAFGYELDLTALGEHGQDPGWPGRWPSSRNTASCWQFGTFWRLKSPFEGNEAAWMTVSSDQRTALVGQYLILQEVNAGYRRPAAGGPRPPTALYRVTRLGSGARAAGQPVTAYGDELMRAGLVTTDEDPASEGDFASHLYLIEAVE